MMDAVDWLSALVRESGGEIIGKTRLQKIVYLLEAKNLGWGFSFDYHNYGPFSAELAFALDDAEALNFISTRERPGFHEIPYTIYEATEFAPKFEKAHPRSAKRSAALRIMNDQPALVLELAATAVYLQKNGYAEDFWNEVRRRKPLKASADRLQSAKKLLRELGFHLAV